MSLKSVNQINSLDDPLKMFLCTFNILTPSKTFDANVPEQLELRAQSFSWPSIQGDVTEVWWGGLNRQFYGKQMRHGDWSVRFTEVYSGAILDGFRKWVNLAHNYKEGKIATLENYATSIEVNLLNPEIYDPVPAQAVAKKIKLYHAWPSAVDGFEIDPNSSNPIEINVTFHYDYFLMGDEIDGAN